MPFPFCHKSGLRFLKCAHSGRSSYGEKRCMGIRSNMQLSSIVSLKRIVVNGNWTHNTTVGVCVFPTKGWRDQPPEPDGGEAEGADARPGGGKGSWFYFLSSVWLNSSRWAAVSLNVEMKTALWIEVSCETFIILPVRLLTEKILSGAKKHLKKLNCHCLIVSVSLLLCSTC